MTTPAPGPEQDPQHEPEQARDQDPTPEQRPTLAQSMTAYAQRSRVRRGETGQLDVLHAVGGWRGLAEAIVPGAVFLGVYIFSQSLAAALICALGAAALFTITRLVQRQSPAQVVGGAVLVLVSALWAWRSGDASNFYATGLMINAAWLVA